MEFLFRYLNNTILKQYRTSSKHVVLIQNVPRLLFPNKKTSISPQTCKYIKFDLRHSLQRRVVHGAYERRLRAVRRT